MTPLLGERVKFGALVIKSLASKLLLTRLEHLVSCETELLATYVCLPANKAIQV